MDDSSGDETTLRIFRRCVIDLFLAAGRREAALAEARRMLEDGWKREEETEAADITPANLIWAVEHGLPEAVDILQGRWPGLKIDRPLTAYAAAVALRARAEPARAAQLADSASAALGEAGGGSTERLRAALLLAKWGATEWATREYRAVVDDPATPAGEFALAGILFSEFLHDHARDDEAAEALRTVVDGRGENAAGDAEQTLRRLERDPKSVRSRLAYFQSCAAAARGDAAGRRRAIDASLRQDGKDVESLIALYQLPDNTPAQQADARARVAQALEQIDDEIGALPGEANGYNEYAWLVANTEGDVRKAIRYSKQSLELSFDNSSYLDTLAHCHAAAGDRAAAIRAQSLAHRLEPHNRTIRRNLDLFRAQAGER
jgi:hypothetical protein